MPSSQRLLTVALPTRNGARHLGETLRSILAQDRAEFELIVADDRSVDDTVQIVRSIAGDRAHVQVNSERLGLAGNWNRCLERARTPWVNVFHQDDVMRPGHLEAQLQVISGNSSLGMVCSGGDVIDDDGSQVSSTVVEWPAIRDHDEFFAPGAFVRELAYSNPVRCSAVSLRRSAHAELGGFDPDWRYAVDWEFWARLARRYPIAWIHQPTIAVRWHPASETHTFKTGTLDLDEQKRLIARIFEFDGDRLPDAPSLRRLADRRLARGYLNRAYEAARGGDSVLARRCLGQSIRLWPGIIGRLALDPRLAVRLSIGMLRSRSGVQSR